MNRCDECGRFTAWEKLTLVGPLYSMDLIGNVSEASYFICDRCDD